MVTQNSDGDANVWRSMVRLSPMIMQKFYGTEENVSLKTSRYVNVKKVNGPSDFGMPHNRTETDSSTLAWSSDFPDIHI